MRKIGILILNYLAYQDTIECVASIKQQTFTDYEILIVDNASTNESCAVLNKTYMDDPVVEVVQTQENLGFARGNNYGIALFKEKNIYNVLVINGDTLFTQHDYLKGLAHLNYDSDVAMIGTEIISRDGKNQNPVPVTMQNDSDLERTRREAQKLEIALKIGVYGILKKLQKKIRKGSTPNHSEVVDETISLDSTQKMLHGSAIFLTENYLSKYIGFYPDTFLYFEEDILAMICQKLKLKQLYVPSLSIYHKEDASVELANDKNHKKSYLNKLKFIKANLILMEEVLGFSAEQLASKIIDTKQNYR